MEALSYTAARNNLAQTMAKVCDDHDPVIITRQNADPVVMLSLADYEAMTETSYLLRSPRNARRLTDAVAQLAEGKGTFRTLSE